MRTTLRAYAEIALGSVRARACSSAARPTL